jgi:hypothetical protein
VVKSPFQTPKNKTSVLIHERLNIESNEAVFFMGSCFGEEISRRLEAKGQPTTANPFGVIFHPKPLLTNWQLIAQSETRASFDQEFNTASVVSHQGLFHSVQHANRFQHADLETLKSQIFITAQAALQSAKSAKVIFVTLGTAWIYHHLPSAQDVGNCHKLPQQDFRKSLSNTADIKGYIQEMATLIRAINGRAHLVFTVSPVRHLRDGVTENLRSKSLLIAALTEYFNERIEGVYYFPAYEIIREELNDWTYYKDDKMHPTAEAIDEVFNRFYNDFFSTNASTFGAEL